MMRGTSESFTPGNIIFKNISAVDIKIVQANLNVNKLIVCPDFNYMLI